MKRLMIALLGGLLGTAMQGSAQSLDDLNIQLHGYATQGFLYTTNNNILTTSSSDGSPAWTEAVVNLSSTPVSGLRVAVQARYFLLGNYGNAITLDFASADYKPTESFGVRFGKVKTPSGLFNEIQDIDPSYLWSLLPQSVYPISSRNSLLAHYGGVVYGTLKLAPKLGKLEYRGWGGEESIGPNDGYFVTDREQGIVFPNGLNEVIYGGALHWRTPLPGLMLGASLSHGNLSNSALTDTIAGYGTFNGSIKLAADNNPRYFASYEKQKLMVAGEFSRSPIVATIQVPGVYSQGTRLDFRAWYAMASYKLTDKFTAGVYDSQFDDHQAVLGPARYQKDWALSTRYDFNQFLYAKAEEHFIDGTAQGYDTALNPLGLKPNTKLTILKVGVSF
jgi:hypothetical protein